MMYNPSLRLTKALSPFVTVVFGRTYNMGGILTLASFKWQQHHFDNSMPAVRFTSNWFKYTRMGGSPMGNSSPVVGVGAMLLVSM
jgi:hypothetical protein